MEMGVELRKTLGEVVPLLLQARANSSLGLPRNMLFFFGTLFPEKQQNM